MDRPYPLDLEVNSFDDWKDRWIGEYLKLFWEIWVGAVIGLEAGEGNNSEGFTDSQMILFIVAVIFNTIVLMNLLLAVVGGVHGDVIARAHEYYYKQIVN